MKSVVYNSYGVWRIYRSQGQLKMYSPIVCEETDLIETDYGYSVCSDDRDNIYIICQDNCGDIYFITVNGEKTDKKCMLESKIKEGYEKNFSLIYVNGWINAVYMLKHENKNIIIHHILNSENRPEIIETVDSYSPVFVCRREDNLFAFYKKEKGIVFKTYKWSEKKWTEPETICGEEDKILFINAHVGDKINVVYCSEKKKRYNAVYAAKGYKYELIKNSASVVKPVICEHKNVMHVIFEYGGRILESTGEENDKILSKPRYSYYGTFERSEAVELNAPDLEKIYTYGFENNKGVFRPLITGDIKENNTSRVASAKEEPEEKEVKQENPNNTYGEILKMLDKSNEMKILSEIAKRLTQLEEVISKLAEKAEGSADGN